MSNLHGDFMSTKSNKYVHHSIYLLWDRHSKHIMCLQRYLLYAYHLFLVIYEILFTIVYNHVRDACVGDNHRGSLNNRGKLIFFRKQQNTNKLTKQ
jgi:hypothetical protein